MGHLALVLAVLAPGLVACSHECPDVSPEIGRVRADVERLERASTRDRERLVRLEERMMSRDDATGPSAARSDDPSRADETDAALRDAPAAAKAAENPALTRFAAAAALSGEQTTKMREMFDRAATETRAAASSLADSLRVTPDQSERLRRQMIDRTAEIRRQLDRDLRGMLTPSQFELYRRSFPAADSTGGGWGNAGAERR